MQSIPACWLLRLRFRPVMMSAASHLSGSCVHSILLVGLKAPVLAHNSPFPTTKIIEATTLIIAKDNQNPIANGCHEEYHRLHLGERMARQLTLGERDKKGRRPAASYVSDIIWHVERKKYAVHTTNLLLVQGSVEVWPGHASPARHFCYTNFAKAACFIIPITACICHWGVDIAQLNDLRKLGKGRHEHEPQTTQPNRAKWQIRWNLAWFWTLKTFAK